jgi:hypothetical protein
LINEFADVPLHWEAVVILALMLPSVTNLSQLQQTIVRKSNDIFKRKNNIGQGFLQLRVKLINLPCQIDANTI